MAKKTGGQKYFDIINEYVDQHKKDVFITLVFVVLLITLAMGYFGLKNKMILKVQIPPVVHERGELVVGYKGANELFYRVWGEWFTSEYASLDYHNVSERLNKILEMVESDKAVVYSKPFQKKADHIKDNRITQHYIPSKQDIMSEPQNGMWIFHSEGLLEEKISNITTKKHCEYNIGMRIVNYHLLLGLINEKCEKIEEVK